LLSSKPTVFVINIETIKATAVFLTITVRHRLLSIVSCFIRRAAALLPVSDISVWSIWKEFPDSSETQLLIKLDEALNVRTVFRTNFNLVSDVFVGHGIEDRYNFFEILAFHRKNSKTPIFSWGLLFDVRHSEMTLFLDRSKKSSVALREFWN